jgi:dTDP-4-dehydrorhamnose reductase
MNSEYQLIDESDGLVILVYGAKGWIGNMMSDILIERGHYIIYGKARLDNYQQLREEINRIKPDRVFSSTGRTHGVYQSKVYSTIDYLELPGGLEKNIKDNLRGPANLAKICHQLGIHVTYMGTGCIFQYDKEHPMTKTNDLSGFTEEDLPNFFGSGYSTVKGQTDLLMRTYDDTVLNCRIRMPITGDDNPRNFITKITSYEKICSIPNSMTVLPNILPIMAQMVEAEVTGTWNMTNPGVITHNEILDRYIDLVDSDFKYKNFTLEEQAKILLSGRSNNYLDTSKLEDYCQKEDLVLMNIHRAVEWVLGR